MGSTLEKTPEDTDPRGLKRSLKMKFIHHNLITLFTTQIQ